MMLLQDLKFKALSPGISLGSCWDIFRFEVESTLETSISTLLCAELKLVKIAYHH